MTDSDADYSECSMDDWNLADASLGAEVIALSDEFLRLVAAYLIRRRPSLKRVFTTNMANGWMDGKHVVGAVVVTIGASYA